MNCSFCSVKIPEGTGSIYVKKDGKVFYFCSSKCEKNMLKLGRKPRVIKWTGEAQKVKSEEKSYTREKKNTGKKK